MVVVLITHFIFWKRRRTQEGNTLPLSEVPHGRVRQSHTAAATRNTPIVQEVQTIPVSSTSIHVSYITRTDENMINSYQLQTFNTTPGGLQHTLPTGVTSVQQCRPVPADDVSDCRMLSPGVTTSATDIFNHHSGPVVVKKPEAVQETTNTLPQQLEITSDLPHDHVNPNVNPNVNHNANPNINPNVNPDANSEVSHLGNDNLVGYR